MRTTQAFQLVQILADVNKSPTHKAAAAMAFKELFGGLSFGPEGGRADMAIRKSKDVHVRAGSVMDGRVEVPARVVPGESTS